MRTEYDFREYLNEDTQPSSGQDVLAHFDALVQQGVFVKSKQYVYEANGNVFVVEDDCTTLVHEYKNGRPEGYNYFYDDPDDVARLMTIIDDATKGSLEGFGG